MIKKKKISNNESWINIFEKFNIIEKIKKEGFFLISADDIKSVDGKEARLMTKYDFRKQIPKILRENNLSLLAIKNGVYKIAKTDPFLDIKKINLKKLIELDIPKNFITIDTENIKSETQALNIAKIGGMLDILFEEKEYELSIGGRERANLSFELNNIFYDIKGVQIEVDGGYESKKRIHLIEAKIGESKDMNIRQLLYPLLYYREKTQNKKEVCSYVFFYNKGYYRFIPYYYDGIVGYFDYKKEKVFKFKDRYKKV